ncbi:MAG: hypothetical protein K6G64_07375 [Eubacterium sp.]|nr:hypothetical protein [Eubacterium sp.]
MRKNKIFLWGLIMGLTISSFSGCGIKTDTPIIGNIVGLKDNEMFKVNELICSKPEYMLVFMDVQNRYKKNLGTGIDWNAKVDDQSTLEMVAKNQTKEEISVRYALASMAKEQEVSLEKDEETAVKSAAESYFNSLNDAEKQYTGAALTDVEALYRNYFLAEKVREKLTEDSGTDISDEQARIIKIQYIHMDGTKTNPKKIKETLKEAKSIVKAGYQPFSREAKQYTVEDSIEKTICKNEATAKYELEAYQLANGEMSDIIQDGNDYYLLYCVESYMKEETEANKQKLIAEEQAKVLAEKYAGYLKDLQKDFNSKQWEGTKVTTASDVASSGLLDYFAESMK